MITFIRDLLFKDFWLKLFSLALAVLIWFTVSFAIKREVSPLPSLQISSGERTFFNLPVVVMSSAADVRNFRVNPKEVEVTVQGDSKSLNKLQSKEIHVLIDLTDIEPVGDLHKRIEVSTPPGVTHVRVYPQDVQVIFPPKS